MKIRTFRHQPQSFIINYFLQFITSATCCFRTSEFVEKGKSCNYVCQKRVAYLSQINFKTNLRQNFLHRKELICSHCLCCPTIQTFRNKFLDVTLSVEFQFGGDGSVEGMIPVYNSYCIVLLLSLAQMLVQMIIIVFIKTCHCHYNEMCVQQFGWYQNFQFYKSEEVCVFICINFCFDLIVVERNYSENEYRNVIGI